jgi:hypothetical protein
MTIIVVAGYVATDCSINYKIILMNINYIIFYTYYSTHISVETFFSPTEVSGLALNLAIHRILCRSMIG